MRKIILCFLCFLCIGTLGAMNEQDRRAYLQWMQASLKDVPEWTAWQKQTGELPPDFDQLPKSNLLPDPLRFFDGRLVSHTLADWTARRNEIKQLFERYMLGAFPPKPQIGQVVLLDEIVGKSYLVRNVRVEFGPQNKGNVRIRVIIPESAARETFPVMISPSLAGWSATVIRRGYISAGYAGNDGMDDAAPLKDLYPNYDFATLSRRAWLAQIVVDYLATLPQVDMNRIAINGYSRDGKMATIAAAIEERIAALIAGSTGVGGTVPWRYGGELGGGEGLESTTRMFPVWFVPRLRFFSGREDYLPVDANLLLALIAPRAALLEWGYNDQVANGWGMEQVYQSAQKVYERLGQPERLSMLAVPGFHGSSDVEASIDWLDLQFGRSTKKWVNHFVFPWNFDKWVATSGERIDLTKYPKQNISAPLANSLVDWKKKAEELLRSLKWTLGDTPLLLEQSANAATPMRRAIMPSPGPTEIAKGKIGNPRQIAPDIHAWVIAARDNSGWVSPEAEQVESRRIRFDGITGDLYYPIETPKGTKLPTVIWLHGYNYPLGYMWHYRNDLHPILALIRAGYAVLAYDQSGFGTRWSEAEHFYERFPHWSRLGMMLEDIHGAVDFLQSDSIVDASRISVFGFTLGGTLGLYAAALDERISGVVSVSGFTPMRGDTPDMGMSGMTRYSHLYGLIPRLGLFAGSESQLPYDYDELIALIAPRPVLIVQPQRDRDASIADVRTAVKRAQGVYTLNRATNKLELLEPDDIGRLTNATQDKIIKWMEKNTKSLFKFYSIIIL
ncbi:Multidomain esterase [termite gut metagenome]|uniref:Multidomain esterase n=1 Tax=termite gut metagenome TaxID=433724 RepID=A0A5J4QSH6_9ZZZZ